MAENEIFKSGQMSVDVAPRTVGILKTSIQFSTQDQGTAKLIFSLSKDGLPLPLSSAATAKIFLRMADGSVFEKNVSIVDQINGKLEYVLEEEISHPGLAKGELNINYANGQALSVCKFSFNIDASLMDQDIVPLAEYYVKDFNTLQSDIEQRAAVINVTVDEMQEKVDAFESTAVTLDPRLTTVEEKVATATVQLADTGTKLELNGWELQNKTREKKPLITFIDDDAYPQVLTKLKPLSETYGIPFVVAAVSNRVDVQSYSLTSAQLRELQDAGWEISSHTHTHGHLGDKTDVDQEFELSESKRILESMGLKITTVCYPFGSYNENTHKFVRKYYRSGRTTDKLGRINGTPLETYDMVVTPLGSWFDTMPNPPFPTNSLEFYKYQVDKAIAENGWLIFMTHVGGNNQHDDIQQGYLEQTIQYIKAKGVEVVTYDEGLNRRGNIVDIGRYKMTDTTIEHLVIGADGKFSGTDLQNVAKKTSGILNGTLPGAIPKDKLLISNVTFSNATGFPENNAGMLITTNFGSGTTAQGFVRQEYRVISKNTVYERYSIDDNTWSEWEMVNIIRKLPSDSVTFASTRTAFPSNAISKCRITVLTGAPEALSGVLTTDRSVGHDYYMYQTYEVTESHNVYKRYLINANGGSWSDWKRMNVLSRTTTQRNSASFTKSTGDMVLDTTLGKPVWYNGTGWVDATGVTV